MGEAVQTPHRFRAGIGLEETGLPFTKAIALGGELGVEYAWFDLDYALADVGDVAHGGG